MLGYAISIAALVVAIWHEKRQDLPSMGDALDQLEEEEGFEFGNQYWLSYDNSSALAIDRKREKVLFLRAYKGWQQINFTDLVEYEMEEKVVPPPTGGLLAFLKTVLNRKAEYKKITVNILINNLDCFNFTLNLENSASESRLKKARKLAKDITTILKIVKINGEKQQQRQLQKVRVVKKAVESANSKQQIANSK